ncbi:hypothetical protein TNCV_2727241 [Trichonephila clavipes]|nr:hypothetical protein TNCV_2727241 [Trichonephila clavipes]
MSSRSCGRLESDVPNQVSSSSLNRDAKLQNPSLVAHIQLCSLMVIRIHPFVYRHEEQNERRENATSDQRKDRLSSKAFGDGPRNFEHGQVTWTTPELPTLLITTRHQREDVSALDRFNLHSRPTRRVFSGSGLELMTCLP